MLLYHCEMAAVIQWDVLQFPECINSLCMGFSAIIVPFVDNSIENKYLISAINKLQRNRPGYSTKSTLLRVYIGGCI